MVYVYQNYSLGSTFSFDIKSKTQLLIIGICMLSVHALAIRNYSAGQQLNVLASSGMNLRDAPKGAVIQKIPYGARVKTLQAKSTSNPETIEGIQGSWVKVDYNGKTGFLFDGFLSAMPAPELNCTNLHDYALQRMRPMSALLEINHRRENIGPSILATQLFKVNADTVVYFMDTYYEGGTEILSMPDISLEEAYLIGKAIFNEVYETTLKELPTLTEMEEEFQLDALKGFVLNGVSVNDDDPQYGNVNDFYFCPLSYGCSYEISIRRNNNRVFLTAGGGC